MTTNTDEPKPQMALISLGQDIDQYELLRSLGFEVSMTPAQVTLANVLTGKVSNMTHGMFGLLASNLQSAALDYGPDELRSLL